MSARKVDPVVFAELYAAGVPMADIAKRFGVVVSTLKDNRKKLGLKARPRGNAHGYNGKKVRRDQEPPQPTTAAR